MTEIHSSRLEQLLAGFAAGDRLALARLITWVENRNAELTAVMERIYPATGHAHLVGITGPPGAGKSTLVNQLVKSYRGRGQTVAVLAIDPSSPFSGGAVLGDRVRMADHYRDPGVFIRSLSTRGSHGGLSRAAREIVKLLDAFKFDLIIVETAGVGQTELGIIDLAHTTVVVTVPEGGDGIQIMKAGLNEIADVFVVNKADRDGADRVKAELELSVHLRPAGPWQPPVVMTKAATGDGVEALVKELERHWAFVQSQRDPKLQAAHRAHEFREILSGELEERTAAALATNSLAELLQRVGGGSLNPYAAVRLLLDDPQRLALLFKKAPSME